MPLQPQQVTIPMAQGVSTKVDPKQVPLGKLLALENGFFQTPQEIRKRYGFNAFNQTVVDGGASIAGANMLAAYRDELVLSDPTNAKLYSYSPGAAKWSQVGYNSTNQTEVVGNFYNGQLTTASVSVQNDTGSGATAAETYPDVAYDSGTNLKCVVWIRSGAPFYDIIDQATGRKIITNATWANTGEAGTTAGITVVNFQGYFVIIYQRNTVFRYRKILATSPNSISAAVDLTAMTGALFDASVFNSRIYIASNKATTGINVFYIDSAFTVSAVTTDTTHAASSAISLCGDSSNNVVIVYSNGTNEYCIVYNANLSATVRTLFTMDTVAGINQITLVANSTRISVYYSAYTNHAATGGAGINVATFLTSNSSAADVNADFMLGVSLASKVIKYNNFNFFFALYGGAVTGQPTLFLLMDPRPSNIHPDDGSPPGKVIGKLAASVAYDATRTIMANMPAITTGNYDVCFLQNAGVNEIAGWGATWLAHLDFTKNPTTAEIANTLHISGGQLWMYDGAVSVEHGFHVYPDNMSAVQTGTGVLAASSTYQYIAVYEWMDNQGQLHRSAPSIPLSITTGGSGTASVAVTVATLRATNKTDFHNYVQVCLYRTTANGTIFYFVAKGTNDYTTNTIAITDANADSAIIGNVELYTTGGQVENSSAPACLAVTTYKSRLVVIPSDNPYSWWFSQEVIPTSASSSATPVELSEFFVQNIDQAGGPLTGVGVMDDKLVLMKKNLPFYIVGSGPAPNGMSNDYSPPQQITSPVGTVNANSLVMTPMGLIFQAANGSGIWLLDRALTPSYIGDEVEAYNSQDVVSATLYAPYNQVRFAMSGGVCLAYDYYVRQWTVMTNVAAVQACLFQGAYSYVRSTGLTLQESSSAFTDNGTFIQLKIITSWLSLVGLQGFQRIYEALILGDYETAHTLNAKVYYDFDPAVAQTTAITPTAVAPYQWRLLFKRQKCESMKIELYDSEISPAEGMRISAITLWVGLKQGLNKMSPARTFD